ncbi:MAG TPA: GNAT family N-acetyltransferase [Micromonosporaceae bacterium]
MEPPELIVDGLLLRGWRAEDAEAVHRACQDPDIQRWTTVPSPYRPDDAAGFVTVIAPKAWAEGAGAPFAVCDAATGDLLGSCGLVTMDRSGRWAEVGYWTAPWARGRGVAVQATRAVTRWAFEMLALKRIVWQAEVGNHASRLVALRAGFVLDGRMRLAEPHPQGTSDGWIGSLLPADLDRPVDERRCGRGSVEARRASVFCGMQPVLRAGGVTLRRPEHRDLDAIVAACRDPESQRWIPLPDPYGPADARFFVDTRTPLRWAAGEGAVYTIADATDAFAGSIELRISWSDPLVGDVGFLVAPSARGRGYAPAALAALCEWGFTTLGLVRIEWRAYVGNEASRRAAEKAGFGHEGTARAALNYRGRRMDARVGALVREETTA